MHAAHHAELPQPHPKHIHQKITADTPAFGDGFVTRRDFRFIPTPTAPSAALGGTSAQRISAPHRRALPRPFAFPEAPAAPRPRRTEPPGKNALRTPRRAVGAPSVPAVRSALCAPPGQTGGRGLQRDAGRPEPPRATAERVKHEENPAPVLGRHPARSPEFLPARSPRYRAGAEVRLRSLASSFLSSFYAAFGAMPPLGGTARRGGAPPAQHPLPNTPRLPAPARPGTRRPGPPSPPLCPRPPAARPAPPAVSPHRLGAAPRPRRESPGPAARLPCGSAILLAARSLVRSAPPSPPDPAAPAGHRLCAPSRHGTPRPRPSRGTVEAGPLRHGAPIYFRVATPPPSWPRAEVVPSPLATLRRWRPSGGSLNRAPSRPGASRSVPVPGELRLCFTCGTTEAEFGPAPCPQHTAPARPGSAGLCTRLTCGLPAPLGSFLSSVCVHALLLINAGQS